MHDKAGHVRTEQIEEDPSLTLIRQLLSVDSEECADISRSVKVSFLLLVYNLHRPN